MCSFPAWAVRVCVFVYACVCGCTIRFRNQTSLRAHRAQAHPESTPHCLLARGSTCSACSVIFRRGPAFWFLRGALLVFPLGAFSGHLLLRFRHPNSVCMVFLSADVWFGFRLVRRGKTRTMSPETQQVSTSPATLATDGSCHPPQSHHSDRLGDSLHRPS